VPALKSEDFYTQPFFAMGTFTNWVLSPASAGWIVGLGTLTLTIIRLARPARLVFAEIGTASLIDVNARIKDRIRVTFNQQPIARLGHVRAEIFNEGSTTIRDAVIKLTVPDSVRILEIVAVSSTDGCEIATQSETHEASITAAYVNPFRDHHHTLIVSLLLDGDVPKVQVAGGGDGWSLRRSVDPLTNRWAIAIATAFTFVLTAWVLLLRTYSSSVATYYGIAEDEISVRAFLLAIVLLLPLFAVIGTMIYTFRPRVPKTSKEILERFRNA